MKNYWMKPNYYNQLPVVEGSNGFITNGEQIFYGVKWVEGVRFEHENEHCDGRYRQVDAWLPIETPRFIQTRTDHYVQWGKLTVSQKQREWNGEIIDYTYFATGYDLSSHKFYFPDQKACDEYRRELYAGDGDCELTFTFGVPRCRIRDKTCKGKVKWGWVTPGQKSWLDPDLQEVVWNASYGCEAMALDWAEKKQKERDLVDY